jgi:hypothetical protein
MKLLKILLLAIFVALLASCASNNRVLSTNSFDFSSSQGLVLISFDDRNLFGTSGMLLSVEDEKGVLHKLASSRHAEKINETSRSEISFSALELKPGRYKVLEWELFRTENGISGQHPNEKFAFDVKSGEVTYIGDLKVIRVVGNGVFSDQFARDKAKFIKYFPFLKEANIVNRAINSSWWPMPGGKKMDETVK